MLDDVIEIEAYTVIENESAAIYSQRTVAAAMTLMNKIQTTGLTQPELGYEFLEAFEQDFIAAYEHLHPSANSEHIEAVRVFFHQDVASHCGLTCLDRVYAHHHGGCEMNSFIKRLSGETLRTSLQQLYKNFCEERHMAVTKVPERLAISTPPEFI